MRLSLFNLKKKHCTFNLQAYLRFKQHKNESFLQTALLFHRSHQNISVVEGILLTLIFYFPNVFFFIFINKN